MRVSQRMLIVGLALGASLTATSITLAGPAGEFCRDVNRGYHINKNWPEPYVYADRDAVCAPFTIMIQKGWQEQNLLGTYHFKTGTNDLTEAGQLKVRWILTQAPQGYRTVFVERGNNVQETDDRVASARRFAERIVIGSEAPDVRESEMITHGWPAEYIDAINVKFNSTTPDPRLPSDSSETGAGGGSGGSQ